MNIDMPVLDVKMVDVSLIEANDYNPNKVMNPEMKLLKKSIIEDGYTQPIVCFFDKQNNKYIIVDGFHRYKVGIELKLSKLPIVTINKELKQRIASTIRHNRARGAHQTQIMSDIVKSLLSLGYSDAEVCKQIGMDAEELLRMKQIMKVEDFFKNEEYGNAWVKYKE